MSEANFEAQFEAQVDAWIRAACKGGPRPFADLVSALPGVDPGVVRDRVAALGPAEHEFVIWRPVDDNGPNLDPQLPVPHPLDFDWRFHPQTVDELSAEVRRRYEPTILLGVPSLFLEMSRKPMGARVLLLDRNPALASRFSRVSSHYSVTTLDLFSGAPGGQLAGSVVADPPWYPKATEVFLRAAAAVSRTGAHIFLSVPPLGMRPGVKTEREDLLNYAERCGLSLREERLASLRYVMPPFERNALRVSGLLPFVPFDWRRGDLLVFERRGGGELPPPPTSPPDESALWQEHTVDGVRIRIRTGASEEEGEDPRLLSLIPGDVLSSVSRRDSRRAAARIWTSGNRIFGCSSPRLLHQLLVGNVNASEGVLREAVETIKVLAQTEHREYICLDPNERTLMGVHAPPPEC